MAAAWDWRDIPLGTRVIYFRSVNGSRSTFDRIPAIFAGVKAQRIRIIVESNSSPDGIRMMSVDPDMVEVQKGEIKI